MTIADYSRTVGPRPQIGRASTHVDCRGLDDRIDPCPGPGAGAEERPHDIRHDGGDTQGRQAPGGRYPRRRHRHRRL